MEGLQVVIPPEVDRVHKLFDKYIESVKSFIDLTSGDSRIGNRIQLWRIIDSLLTAESKDTTGDFPRVSNWINRDKFDNFLRIPPDLLSDLLIDVYRNPNYAWDEDYYWQVRHQAKISLGSLNTYQSQKLRLEIMAIGLADAISSVEFLQAFENIHPVEQLRLHNIFSTGLFYSEALPLLFQEGITQGDEQSPTHFFSKKRQSDLLNTIENFHKPLATSTTVLTALGTSYKWSNSFHAEQVLNFEEQKELTKILVDHISKCLQLLAKNAEKIELPERVVRVFDNFGQVSNAHLEDLFKSKSAEFKGVIEALPSDVRTSLSQVFSVVDATLGFIDLGLSVAKVARNPDSVNDYVGLLGSVAGAIKTMNDLGIITLSSKTITPKLLERTAGITAVINSAHDFHKSVDEGSGAGIVGHYISTVGGVVAFASPVLGAVIVLLGFGVTLLAPGKFEQWVLHSFFGHHWSSVEEFDSLGPFYPVFGFNKVKRQIMTFQAFPRIPDLEPDKPNPELVLNELSSVVYDTYNFNPKQLQHINQLKQEHITEQNLRASFDEIILTIKEPKFTLIDKIHNDRAALILRFWDEEFPRGFFFESPVFIYAPYETIKVYTPQWNDQNVYLIDLVEGTNDLGFVSEIQISFLIKKTFKRVGFKQAELEAKIYDLRAPDNYIHLVKGFKLPD